MSLVLEVEHLTGVARAAIGPDSAAPDWPPQPDRVFSALVATWGAHGRDEEEAAALRWLECQEVPEIAASEIAVRLTAETFVPPNDPTLSRRGGRGVLPEQRSRQPRRFPAARPFDPVVRLHWPSATPDDATLSALGRLARDTAYVGHSASLTRCRFARADLPSDAPPPRPARRRVYPGRLDELETVFQSGRRPRPGDPVAAATWPAQPSDLSVEFSVFSDRWLLLENVGDGLPDVRAAAIACRAIRDTLMSGYQRAGLGDRIPPEVSGHAPGGALLAENHLAVVPLTFTGFAHADGSLLGFGIVPSRGSGLLDDQAFRAALRTVAQYDDDLGRHVMAVGSRPGAPEGHRLWMELAITAEPAHRSLDPTPYLGPSRTYATVTPIVLNRHLKGEGAAREREVVTQIIAACGHIGLTLPDATDVVPGKHATITGAPSAWPSGRAPGWTAWRLPSALSSRSLIHAVVRFPRPVAGPVILGSGRYLGLGLCRALPEDARS